MKTYRILRLEWLVINPVPSDAECKRPNEPEDAWRPSIYRGQLIPKVELNADIPLLYRTAKPTPSGPTAGDSMNVRDPNHDDELKAAREENRILKGLLDQARVELVGKQQSRAVLEQCAGEEIDELKHSLQAAETKAGAMEEAHKRSLESDSPVGSCGCLTKSPEVKYHKPGCKYRLIVERNEYKAMTEGVPGGLLAQALARAETAEAALRSAQGLVKGYTYGGALYAYIELTKAIEALPPTAATP